MTSKQPRERSTAHIVGSAWRPGIVRRIRLGRLLLLPVLAGMALLGPGSAQATTTWQSGPSLASARAALAATTAPCPSPSTDICLYAIGGTSSSGTPVSSVEYYDPRTGTSVSWQSGPSLTRVRYAPGATTAPCPSPSTGTCLYAIGGTDSKSTSLSSVEYYDPSTGTGGSWQSAPSLATARNSLGAATGPCPSPSTRTCLYAIGGNGNSYTALSSVEYYDPSTGTSGSWQSGPALGTARNSLGATSAPCPSTSTRTCLYAIGGADSGYIPLSGVEYYDPSTGTGGSWQSGPSLTTARAYLDATTATCPSPSTGTCLYAIGGADSTTALSSVEYYGPSAGTSGSWQSGPSLTTARQYLGATTGPCPSTSTRTCLYAIGGYDGNNIILSSVEYYDPTGAPTVSVLAHTHLLRSHSRLVVSWGLTARAGVVGFRVYAGRQQLTAHLIPTHASPRYRAVFETRATGRVSVHVLRTDGHAVSIAVH